MMKIVTVGLMVLSLWSSAWADPSGFWLEGEQAKHLKVNPNLEQLHPKAFYNVAEAVKASVVNISTVKITKDIQTPFGFRLDPDFPSSLDHPLAPFLDRFLGQPRSKKQTSLGSGFVLNKEGYIVTNQHVISQADEIVITFFDETQAKAEIVGRDIKTDVALLKLTQKTNVKPVILGQSRHMHVGDVVIAIGNPFGLSHTVTQGIISAKERTIGLGPYDDFIQTDASINPGNSGGPLLNLHGEVIGINTAIHASGQGIGFTIPIDLAKDILIGLKQDGHVIRAHLGVRVQAVENDHVQALGLKDKQGALVVEVIPDTPASRAGIEPGDVIIAFDGQKIHKWDQLPKLVAQTKVGKKVKVQLVRQQKTKTLTVEVDELAETASKPEAQAPSQVPTQDQLGLKVGEITEQIRKALNLSKHQKGAVILDIHRSSKAFQKGLRPSDVILELNQNKIENVADYQQEVEKIQKGDSVLVLVLRENRKLFLAFTHP